MNVKIHNLKWDVEFTFDDNFIKDDSIESVCGLTKKTDLKIYINVNLPDDLVYRTIIHELAHAYVWTYGFENLDSFKEEDLCNFIETYSIQLLKDADEVFKEYKVFKKGISDRLTKVEKILKSKTTK